MHRGWLLLITASATALAACGSSRSPAPVIYGSQPVATGRVYNSPADYRPAPQREAQPSYQAPAYSPPVSGSPARLTPVTAASLDDPSGYGSGARSPNVRYVTVQPGDTVYAISRRTGAAPQAIIAENRMRAPYALEIGQTVRIPDARGKIANDLAPAPQPRALASAQREERAADVRVVRPGDTLYSISRKTGVPVTTIARANGLRAPYEISPGQQLRIPDEALTASAPVIDPEVDVAEIARSVSYTKPAAAPQPKIFEWPLKGAIIGEYGAGRLGQRNDGVNIAAPVGTPIRAAAAGEVVYRGSELDGYGNLLLIKHADGFITAYAHNDAMLVKKGDRVEQGQVIAKVGQTGDAAEPQLHFEIRQNLKSVDPLALLQ